MKPRPYRGLDDWQKMQAVLIEGRRANNGSYYVHMGDVQWWLFHPNQEAEFPQRIFLWEEGQQLIGWCLLTPDQRFFDVFVAPADRGSARAEAMQVWAEERLREQVKAQSGEDIRAMWVFETDEVMTAHLRRRGFKLCDEFMTYNTRSLAEGIPAPQLPDGCTVRPVDGEHELERRATPSHAAFRSRFAFDQYCTRYLSFMRSRVYDRERDMMVIAPGERCAAFCVFWLDPANRVGLFEPVGTHPEFQGRGIGKALLLESLRRMKTMGMEMAIVCAEHDNVAAQRLYRSVGFRTDNRLRMYAKKI